MLKRTLAAATVALTLAGAGLALAQTTPSPRMRPTAEDVAALTDARIAALKAGLKLTPEQEKNWPAVESAIRDRAKVRADRMKERADRRTERREAQESGDKAAAPRPGMIDRMRQRADAMDARADEMKKFADAVEPLYKSLNDDQKRRFAMLLRMNGARHGQHHHQRHSQRRAEIAR